MSHNILSSEIAELKARRKAIILAHNYMIGEVQDVADFVGDSLELSRRAHENEADCIVFCGVRFMAETAKILSPSATVLLPRLEAGCPMADNVDVEALRQFKREHPEYVLVAYVNTTAEVKAEVDICCTSGNVDRIVASLGPDVPILFLPDRNLGANISRRLSREMKMWPGCCPIHDALTAEDLLKSKKEHPGALVMIHPECRPEVVELADAALSTSGMFGYAKESAASEFIVATESGILHRLRLLNPGKKFYPVTRELLCPDMKTIALTDVRDALLHMRHQIRLDGALIDKARKPIEKMLAVR